MTVELLFLRGINVGGHNRVPMADLRSLLASLGAGGVQTYIQSGNAVYSGHVPPQKLSQGIRDRFGCDPAILQRSLDDYRRIAHSMPFGAAADPKHTMLYLHDEPADIDAIAARLAEGEKLHATTGGFWLSVPSGLSKSKIAGQIDRVAGTVATARNWRTVEAVLAMAMGMS